MINGCTPVPRNAGESARGQENLKYFNLEDDAILDLDNADIRYYPGTSANYTLLFNIVSKVPLSKDNFGLEFDKQVAFTYELLDATLVAIDYKDYLIKNSFNWNLIKEGYLSKDIKINAEAHATYNAEESQFTKLVESLGQVPYAYQIVLNFNNPPLNTELNKVVVKINDKTSERKIGSIKFTTAEIKHTDAVGGPTGGPVGRKTVAKSNKQFKDDTGLYQFDFTAKEAVILKSVVPDNDAIGIDSMVLRLSRNGVESTVKLEGNKNLDYEIKKGDQFSIVPTYSSSTKNRQTVYAQTYNSYVNIEFQGNVYSYLQESGIINTVHTIAALLSQDNDSYKRYYFDFLEVVELYDSQRLR